MMLMVVGEKFADKWEGKDMRKKSARKKGVNKESGTWVKRKEKM